MKLIKNYQKIKFAVKEARFVLEYFNFTYKTIIQQVLYGLETPSLILRPSKFLLRTKWRGEY